MTTAGEDIVFVECGADMDHPKYKFRRKMFMWPDQTDPFRDHYNNTGIYQTVMHYINPIWIEDDKGRVVVNATDSLKIGDFYLDFDNVIESEEDYQKIKSDVKKAVRYLTIILSIDISQIQFYYSGNKGIHLIIDSKVMALSPHAALNQVYKEIAKDIEKFCEYGTLDMRVYDDKRLFRLENSINKKSGLYKVPITYEEFKNDTFQDIIKKAENPRSIKKAPVIFSPKAKKAFEKYIEAWTIRLNNIKEYEGNIRELKVVPPCIKVMREKIFRETVDERNNSAAALTSFYFQQGIPREESMQRMIQWGEENCQPALKKHEIETTVNSIYNNQYRYGCETFKSLSGVCERDVCPIFHSEFNVEEDTKQE